jgi:hypothetical protein
VLKLNIPPNVESLYCLYNSTFMNKYYDVRDLAPPVLRTKTELKCGKFDFSQWLKLHLFGDNFDISAGNKVSGMHVKLSLKARFNF